MSAAFPLGNGLVENLGQTLCAEMPVETRRIGLGDRGSSCKIAIVGKQLMQFCGEVAD